MKVEVKTAMRIQVENELVPDNLRNCKLTASLR